MIAEKISVQASFRAHKQDWGWLVLLASLFLASRLFDLLSFPTFVDEMAYYSQAKLVEQDFKTYIPVALYYGHGPLYFFLEIIIMKFVQLPLLAGRLISVAAGLASMFLMYLIGKSWWNKTVGRVAALLLIFSPYALVYQRMAVFESTQLCFVLLALYATILITQTGVDAPLFQRHNNPYFWQIWYPVILLICGLASAFLTKFNSILVLVGCVAALLASADWRNRQMWARWGIGTGVATLIGLMQPFLSKTYLDGMFGGFEQLTYPLDKFLFSPQETWLPRLPNEVILPLSQYLTFTVTLTVVGALILASACLIPRSKASLELKKAARFALVPLIAALGLTGPSALVIFIRPRYLFTGTVLVLLMAAWFIVMAGGWLVEQLQAKRVNLNYNLVASGLVTLIILPGFWFTINWIADPIQMRLPARDYLEYVEGTPSGFGAQELNHKIRIEANGAPLNLIVLGPEGWRNQLRGRISADVDLSVTGIDSEEVWQESLPAHLVARDRRNLVIFVNNTERFKKWQTLNPRSDYRGAINRPNNAYPFVLFSL